MSGIFNLFNGTGNSAKQQFSSGPGNLVKKSSATSMSLENTHGTSGKNVGSSRPKPKGLSIRSNSDLNVTSFGVNGERSPTKKISPLKGRYSKTENAQVDGVSRQLLPRGGEKNSKLQVLKSKQLKALSSKFRSLNNVSPTENTCLKSSIFTKPFTPKVKQKPADVYPEPEKLANFCDEFKEDLDAMADDLDRAFVRLVRTTARLISVKPYEDEGFESDPGLIELPKLSFKGLNDSFEEEITTKSPSLPSISDDDDIDDVFN